jgi:hypothetical protein
MCGWRRCDLLSVEESPLIGLECSLGHRLEAPVCLHIELLVCLLLVCLFPLRATRHTAHRGSDPHPHPDLTIRCTSLYSAPHYTLHFTILRTSLYAAPHYTLHLTILCTSLYSTPRYTLHLTTRRTSLYAAPHCTLHLTMRCTSRTRSTRPSSGTYMNRVAAVRSGAGRT